MRNTERRLRRRLQVLVAMATFLLLPGCATVRTVDLAGLTVGVPASGQGKIAVTVLDERREVRGHEQDPEVIGWVRTASLAQEPVRTLSGKPLAEDLAASIGKSFEARGFEVVPTSLAPGADYKAAVAALKGTGAWRLVLLVVHDLGFEHYARTRFHHNLSLYVLDEMGVRVATTGTRGDNRIGTPMRHDRVRENVETSVRLKLNELLNNDFVEKALAQ